MRGEPIVGTCVVDSFSRRGAMRREVSSVIWSRYNQASLLNILLERKDDIFNTIFAIAIALSFYIVTAILLHKLKKPR